MLWRSTNYTRLPQRAYNSRAFSSSVPLEDKYERYSARKDNAREKAARLARILALRADSTQGRRSEKTSVESSPSSFQGKAESQSNSALDVLSPRISVFQSPSPFSIQPVPWRPGYQETAEQAPFQDNLSIERQKRLELLELSRLSKAQRLHSRESHRALYRLIHVLIRMRQFWLAGIRLHELLTRASPDKLDGTQLNPTARLVHRRTVNAVLTGLFSSVERAKPKNFSTVYRAPSSSDLRPGDVQDKTLQFGLELYNMARNCCTLVYIQPTGPDANDGDSIPGRAMHREMLKALLRQGESRAAAVALRDLLISISEIVALTERMTPERKKANVHARLASEHVISLVAQGIQRNFELRQTLGLPGDGASDALGVLAPIVILPSLEVDMIPLWRLLFFAYRTVPFQEKVPIPANLGLDVSGAEEGDVRVSTLVYSIIKKTILSMHSATVIRLYGARRETFDPILIDSDYNFMVNYRFNDVHNHTLASLFFVLNNVYELFPDEKEWCTTIATWIAHRINSDLRQIDLALQRVYGRGRRDRVRGTYFWSLLVAPFRPPKDEVERLLMRERWTPDDVLSLPFLEKMTENRHDEQWLQNVEIGLNPMSFGSYNPYGKVKPYHWIQGQKWWPAQISQYIDPISIADIWVKLRWGEEEASLSRQYRGPAPIDVPVLLTHVPTIEDDPVTLPSSSTNREFAVDRSPPLHELHELEVLWDELSPHRKLFEDKYGRLVKQTDKAVRQESFESWDVSEIFSKSVDDVERDDT